MYGENPVRAAVWILCILAAFSLHPVLMGNVQYEVKVIREEGVEPLKEKIASLEKQVKELEAMQPPNYSPVLLIIVFVFLLVVLVISVQYFEYKKNQLEAIKERNAIDEEKIELEKRQFEEPKVGRK